MESGRASDSEGAGDALRSAVHAIETAFAVCVDSATEASSYPVPRNHFLFDRAMQDLRRCVTEYTTASRAIGRSPEETLIILKDLLRDTLRRPLDNAGVAAAAIAWCIDAYYPMRTETG